MQSLDDYVEFLKKYLEQWGADKLIEEVAQMLVARDSLIRNKEQELILLREYEQERKTNSDSS